MKEIMKETQVNDEVDEMSQFLIDILPEIRGELIFNNMVYRLKNGTVCVLPYNT